jgi:antitoxin HicB
MLGGKAAISAYAAGLPFGSAMACRSCIRLSARAYQVGYRGTTVGWDGLGRTDGCQFAATKTVLALQIADAMVQGITKTSMASRMGTTRAQLDRLLDPNNDSVTLATLKRAAKALGKRLTLELV